MQPFIYLLPYKIESKVLNSSIPHIVRACLKNDLLAKRQLFELHKIQWLMICRRYGRNLDEAKDMLQAGLIEIFQDLKQFDAERGNFSAWSNRVIANAAIRYLKKWKYLSFSKDIEDYQDYFIENHAESQDAVNTEEIIKAIQKLPPGFRVVFNMYVLEGYTHQEIADYLKISVGTSKSQLSRAKKQLRTWLEIVL